MIFKGEVGEIKELMKRSRELGMQTFDQALFDLYEANIVTYEDALRNADSVNDLRLQIKLQQPARAQRRPGGGHRAPDDRLTRLRRFAAALCAVDAALHGMTVRRTYDPTAAQASPSSAWA